MWHNTFMKRQSSYQFDPHEHERQLIAILRAIEAEELLTHERLLKILKKHPKDGKGYFSKSQLISAYRYFAGTNGLESFNPLIIDRLKMKPVRTISGVSPITILTKPFACPGKCIFCPNDVRMPKSYLSSEPGAQRAEKNGFDPYLQTYNRLDALKKIGHNVSKAEVIVLGGTWSLYPLPYKLWFITRMFEALNDFAQDADQRSEIKLSIDVSQVKHTHQGLKRSIKGMKITYNQAVALLYKDQELEKRKLGREVGTWENLKHQQQINERAGVRCVGLVLETRPDAISQNEIIQLRRMGCTKTQIGLQSLNDEVLKLNKRGHDVSASRRAMRLIRQAGLKIHAHWMPNLYGSNPERDIDDFRKLFSDPNFKPDELKIYPCSLIDYTELMSVWEKGLWQPYSYDQLLKVLVATYKYTPRYCRLTRIVRDISSDDIVTGNKLTNFRQIAHQKALELGVKILDIRHREIGTKPVKTKTVKPRSTGYDTAVSMEYFLEYVTKKDEICGFLRLSLPTKIPYIKELEQSAIIREVHVYGQAVGLGKTKAGAPQHLGLGKKLISRAVRIAKRRGYKQLSVISAIGTKPYYRKLGFADGKLYQHKSLVK